MASADWTVHIELMGQDRELLERVNENIEWYRKHLQEQSQMMFAQDQAQKRQETELREAKEKLSQPLSAEDHALLMQVEQEAQKKGMKGHLLDKMGRD